ncbi:hypothetical protein [Ruminiclostridium papyrosolvens]|uniref:Uncharacterized protein n=1 Tax=Ruminiclostridium papyrosolvens C7 TaxID=1330534 RepID=U4R3K1_9FIRM|nr:hypothetical protein [Ruminiclostridium papyrosolvens]EPR12336.1 hypothetical protein L323_08485 [Ruminiclostridium papyrosolvens C7]
MAVNTVNYNLKKPSQEDFYNIGDHNGNMDIIDTQIKKIETELEGHVGDTHNHVPHLGTTVNNGNTYTIDSEKNISDGSKFSVKFNAIATGSATLNISSDGLARSLKKPSGEDFKPKAGIYSFIRDGENFQLLGEGGADIIPIYSGLAKITRIDESKGSAEFYSSGTLTWSTVPQTVDIFLVGGGANGEKGGDMSGDNYFGGNGGGSGYTSMYMSVNIEAITTIIVGSGGIIGGQSKVGTIYVANGASGRIGGSNGGFGGFIAERAATNGGSNGTPGQGTSTCDFFGTIHAAGGGGGASSFSSNNKPGIGGFANGTGGAGTKGGLGSGGQVGDGGTGGGGYGGGGGGGGCGSGIGGSGGSGIVIIRWGY